MGKSTYFTLKVKTKSQNEHSLRLIYVRLAGVVKSTGLKCSENGWNKERQRVRNKPPFIESYVKINDRLNKIENFGNSLDLKYTLLNENLTNEVIIKEIENFLNPKNDEPSDGSYLDFFYKEIEHRKTYLIKGKKITSQRITQYYSKGTIFKEFEEFKGFKITFDLIDEKLIADFSDWLILYKKYMPTTVGGHLNVFKAFLNVAEEIKMWHGKWPKGKVKISRKTRTLVFLTVNELDKVFEAFDKNKYKGMMQKALDSWILLILSGWRVSDLKNISEENIRISNNKNKYINISNNKTGAIIVAPIDNRVQIILDRYENKAPKISSQRINSCIKIICKDLKFNNLETITYERSGVKVVENIEKWRLITCHTNRRSFVTNSLLKGVSNVLISAQTGQSDATIKIYNKSSSSDLIDAIATFK